MLFGPAYKGITLVSSTAVALADMDLDVPFSYNRKERKDHGEGGELIGAPLRGRVMIVDDVITDGAAKREALDLIRAHGAQPAGVVIMLDRMERSGADGALSQLAAVQAFEQDTGVPVISIADLDDLIGLLRSDSLLAATVRHHLPSIEAYRKRYGA
jgi:orotate phosphoribosyltransferase